jgi:plastocyanin
MVLLKHQRRNGVTMKTFTSLFAVVVLGAALATAATSSTTHAKITIRHQTSHCHAWALGHGPYTAHLDAALAAGGTITITNNDVMSHRLIEKGGPSATISGSPAMSHMGATTTVKFLHPGTYVFTTKTGEDYMKGVKTTGEDNVLTLRVVVR